MTDRHAVKRMLSAGLSIGEVARHMKVSRRTIERIRKEPPVETADDGIARRARGVGQPGVADGVRARMRTLMTVDPEAPPLAARGRGRSPQAALLHARADPGARARRLRPF